jgi:type IV secretory pathway VirB4 component
MAVKSKAAQDFVPIDDIYDGVVILKDGTMRMVVMASSINFALKSTEEQQAILLQFQSFLNSLEFSTQIYIQSRRLDIRPYIALLNQRLKEDVGDLMRIQIEEYASFVKGFTDDVNIMTKNFFIVVPYTPSGATTPGSSSNEPKTKEQSKLERIEEGKNQLQQRTNIIKQGLVRVGIRVMPLGTEEVVELFYRIFNPSDTGKPIKLV